MIKVIEEPDMGDVLENCFHCRTPTKYWYAQKDVACCQDCAMLVLPRDVPCKTDWINEAY